jgi:hypothetical protein
MTKVSLHGNFFLVAFLTSSLESASQIKITANPEIIAYNRIHSKGSSLVDNFISVLPMTVNRYYVEVRYNYDFHGTSGVYVGKVFSWQRKVRHSIIPQVGILNGDFMGDSFQFYYRVASKRLELNFQNQYSTRFRDYKTGFYYNWSSIEVSLTHHISVGGSTQFYCGYDNGYNDNGVFAMYKKLNFNFFLFDFNAYDPKNHYLLTGLVFTLRLPKSTHLKSGLNRTH